ncbi:MAG: hypothetical protein KDD63_18380 [Bacteroidetes bacterium]|nr:hypothetical protein [Bacteroidota bacterium]
MKSNTILEEIGGLIVKDHLKEAIEKLSVLLKGSKLLDEVILQSGRYTDIMKQIRQNTVNFENASITKNQIRFALMDITRILEEERTKDPEIGDKIEKVADRENLIQITDSKNVNTGNVNTGGGDFRIGDG